jgi:hypothetical protein
MAASCARGNLAHLDYREQAEARFQIQPSPILQFPVGSSPMRRLPARAAPDQCSCTVGGVAHPFRTIKERVGEHEPTAALLGRPCNCGVRQPPLLHLQRITFPARTIVPESLSYQCQPKPVRPQEAIHGVKVSSRVPQIPILGSGKLQFFPCPLRSIKPRRRTMGIVKPMKEIVAGVDVASVFPGPISREPARSGPSPSDDLINTPSPT